MGCYWHKKHKSTHTYIAPQPTTWHKWLKVSLPFSLSHMILAALKWREKEKETDDECLVHLLALQACVCVWVTEELCCWLYGLRVKTVFHANTKTFLCFQCFMHTDTWISHFAYCTSYSQLIVTYNFLSIQ